MFCSDYEHLCEMTDKVPEWFGKIDETPHIYKAYSEDPSADEAFAAFKQDGSEHLKLLFCIDMLNEGVHVDDVSGVILLRPTVPPIIYKQQIRRALSASKKTNPVIFDIVLNIENLYSIGSMEDEMQVATAYYRKRGESDKIAVENFRVYDEVRECRLLLYLLIPCRLGTGNAGMPSIVWSIMACNTPIIASFDIDSDLADVLISSGAGRCVQPESAEALAEAIKDAYMVYSAGNKSSADIRKYVIQNASKDVCVKKYVETMMYVVEHRGERCL